MNNTKKKRGRKPKGGKIINNSENNSNKKNEEYNPSIILHLKCKSSSIKTNYEYKTDSSKSFDNCENIEDDPIINTKNINDKLKILNKDLHINHTKNCNICFWDTCSFSNNPVYIHINNKNVYGCFCSPECAAAYLFNEHCDINTKWERYSLLHNVYSNIYNYTNNIKLAPSPYYLLNKYYGNLTIEEYRKLHTNDKQIMILNKPITVITPELHEIANNNIKVYTGNINKQKNMFN